MPKGIKTQTRTGPRSAYPSWPSVFDGPKPHIGSALYDKSKGQPFPSPASLWQFSLTRFVVPFAGQIENVLSSQRSPESERAKEGPAPQNGQRKFQPDPFVPRSLIDKHFWWIYRCPASSFLG